MIQKQRCFHNFYAGEYMGSHQLILKHQLIQLELLLNEA